MNPSIVMFADIGSYAEGGELFVLQNSIEVELEQYYNIKNSRIYSSRIVVGGIGIRL